MGFATAISLVLIGSALLLVDFRFRGLWPAQYLAATVNVIALLTILGYLYGVHEQTGIASLTKTAIHSAAGFFLLSGGVLLAWPDRGIMAPLTSERSGGWQARRILPVLLIFNVVLGGLRLTGEREGLFGTEFGLSLMIVANSLFFTLAMWLAAVSLNRSDEAQARVQASLRDLNEGLEIRVAERTAQLDEANQTLRQLVGSLERSNSELEQFAYVASHDLQEPLRMVSNYTQLLARRYKGQLDGDADEFIEFAVDGAKRMQALINDLLQFSRVNTQGQELVAVEMEQVLDKALNNLRVAIEESGAEVSHDPLPTALGDDGQLTQLLQNLIGNAIKFRGNRPPRIHVAAVRENGGWRVIVADDGIGIAPEHHERIFAIFQRLHDRSQYEGTGIGLAICKRIVERHGGHITVESEPGRGARFGFNLTAVESAVLPSGSVAAA